MRYFKKWRIWGGNWYFKSTVNAVWIYDEGEWRKTNYDQSHLIENIGRFTEITKDEYLLEIVN